MCFSLPHEGKNEILYINMLVISVEIIIWEKLSWSIYALNFTAFHPSHLLPTERISFFCLYLQPFLITQGPCLHMASTTQHFLAVLCFSASALWPGELKSLIIEHPIGKCASSPCVCPALRMLANVNNPLSSIIPVLVGFIKDNRLIQSVIMCGEETCQEVTIGMTNTI